MTSSEKQSRMSQETTGFETPEEAGIPTKEMRVDVSDTEAYRTRRQDETILTPVYIADHQDNCTASTSCLLHWTTHFIHPCP
jgi:hypothetical protein